MDKPKHWVKNAIKKNNLMSGFVHISPKVGLKQPSIVYSVYIYIFFFNAMKKVLIPYTKRLVSFFFEYIQALYY